jgi:hypothetical protein
VPVPPSLPTQLRRLALVVLGALALGGCGSAGHSETTTRTKATTGSGSSAAVNDLPAAEHPQSSGFPSAHGRTLQQVASAARVRLTAQFGAATGTFTPGRRRLAFALNTSTGKFVYAPTVVYLSRTPDSPALGPFAAPADPMTVGPQYRSRQNAGPGGVQAIYETEVPLASAGTYDVLALTQTSEGLIGSPGEIAVARTSAIPDVGQRPPAIATDTLASTHHDLALLTTRLPPENMHAVSFAQVLGRRPVALLFSTPQLCLSKVCGPVTDIVVSLQRQFGDRVSFVHEEVYVKNQPAKGLRPQMKAFHLQTEPWLFTITRSGVIAARLEGAFGVSAVTRALEAALR